MDKPRPKLVTWKNWVIAVCAAIVGVSLRPYREYSATGSITSQTLVIALITLVIGLCIISAVFWYANRPEKEDKP